MCGEKHTMPSDSKLSWGSRLYVWPPTWSMTKCDDEEIVICESSHVSKNYVLCSAAFGIVGIVVGACVVYFTGRYGIGILIAVHGVVCAGLSVALRCLELRHTGNEGDIALNVTKDDVYFGKPGVTVSRRNILKIECAIDYSPSYYRGDSYEGVYTLYSEIDVVVLEAGVEKRYPVVGVEGDSCLGCARRIAKVTGWDLVVVRQPTWSMTKCDDEEIVICESSHVSKNYVLCSAAFGIVGIVVGACVAYFTGRYGIGILIAVHGVVFAGLSVAIRCLVLRHTGNEGDIALNVTKDDVYFGKPGVTVSRRSILKIECVIDYSPSYYRGDSYEGVYTLYSEIDVVVLEAGVEKRYHVVGVEGDSCLGCARRIAKVTGWDLVVVRQPAKQDRDIT